MRATSSRARIDTWRPLNSIRRVHPIWPPHHLTGGGGDYRSQRNLTTLTERKVEREGKKIKMTRQCVIYPKRFYTRTHDKRIETHTEIVEQGKLLSWICQPSREEGARDIMEQIYLYPISSLSDVYTLCRHHRSVLYLVMGVDKEVIPISTPHSTWLFVCVCTHSESSTFAASVHLFPRADFFFGCCSGYWWNPPLFSLDIFHLLFHSFLSLLSLSLFILFLFRPCIPCYIASVCVCVYCAMGGKAGRSCDWHVQPN